MKLKMLTGMAFNGGAVDPNVEITIPHAVASDEKAARRLIEAAYAQEIDEKAANRK